MLNIIDASGSVDVGDDFKDLDLVFEMNDVQHNRAGQRSEHI